MSLSTDTQRCYWGSAISDKFREASEFLEQV